jgi:hypothetical protein
MWIMREDIKKMNRTISLNRQKHAYYRWLLMDYRGGNKDAMAIIIYKKFRKSLSDYKIIRCKAKKQSTGK